MTDFYVKHASIFEKYGITNVNLIRSAWQEKHRFYHTEAHLSFLLNGIEAQNTLTSDEKETLILVAYFHDIVYDPTRQDNEEKSAELFEKIVQDHEQKALIKNLIIDTKTHTSEHKLGKIFNDLDMHIVRKSSFPELLKWERQIFKEFQYLDYKVYKAVRLELLDKFAKSYPENERSLHSLMNYVEDYKPKVGIYPGSFNPFHYGHLNILRKAENVFDKVVIARGINPDKTSTNTNPIDIDILKYRQTENFGGFLTDYITSKEDIAYVTLIRGLRNGDDLDYEVNQLRFMQDMKSNLNIIFLVCDKEFEHISSSSIKNLNKIDAKFSEKYIPS